ncbi:MAG: hypothetical protein IPN29_16360 [Saprospiraceae bacterium]|nr:hypothetical protein [Saprospiraceae bacterium]
MEIVRYIVPSLVVFATVYFLMNKWYRHQIFSEQLRQGSKHREKVDGIKMQACERLILLCERIEPVNLYMRLNTGDMTAKQMQEAMMIAIQQEFTHNYTQQLYVSPALWKIILLAKDQVLDIISQTGDKLYPSDPPGRLIELIQRVFREINIQPLDQAKSAIKSEIDLIL